MNLTRYMTDLYLLVQVINAGGFSAAARNMGSTRSLLSRHICELEKALGVRLLHRDARRFAVTAAGEEVYRQAVLMCDAANAAITTAQGVRGAGRGLLRVGVSSALLPMVIDALTAFTEQYPQMQLQTSAEESVDTLLRQRTDVVLHHGSALPDSADIIARPLGQVWMVVVASPMLLKQLGHPQHPDEIESRYRLCYTGLGATPLDVPPGKNAGGNPARMVSDRIELIIRAARSGLGIAWLPLDACREDLAQGRLEMACHAYRPGPLPLHALTTSGYGSGNIPINFINFLRDHLDAEQGPDLLPTRTGTDHDGHGFSTCHETRLEATRSS